MAIRNTRGSGRNVSRVSRPIGNELANRVNPVLSRISANSLALARARLQQARVERASVAVVAVPDKTIRKKRAESAKPASKLDRVADFRCKKRPDGRLKAVGRSKTFVPWCER